MFSLKYSKRFKRDLKLYGNDPEVLKDLELVLDLLIKGESLKEKYKNHNLRGEFKSCSKCHIRPDLLLVYKIEKDKLLILLLRLVSHSDIF